MTSTENHDRQDDSVIERLLSLPESYNFDCKRITGKVDKLLETVIAFANADGGMIAIGMEDPDKGTGRDRRYRRTGTESAPDLFSRIFRSETNRWWAVFFTNSQSKEQIKNSQTITRKHVTIFLIIKIRQFGSDRQFPK